MEILLWLSVGLILYSYFIYPCLLIFISGLKQSINDTKYLSTADKFRPVNINNLPTVSIIIAAYNEDSCIEERIKNLLALDYPAEKLNIYIGSDGSTDNTVDILNCIVVQNVTVHIFDKNRGKMSVLNDLVAFSQDEFIIMSDANTHFNTDVILKLIRHFQNSHIGAVCGELHLIDAKSGDNKDSLYWRYEQILKFHEARLNALLGANGAIYAIRRNLFKPLPPNTITDDYQIVMNVARQNYKIIYDPEAIAIEEVAPNLRSEAGRRIRIGLGNYQAFFSMGWPLNPLLGWRFIAYISHKVCRWFVPHFMLVALISNALLLENQFYQLLFLGQIVFYLIALYGIQRQKKQYKVGSLIGFITFFVSMNIALLRGFVRYFSSNVQGTWQRTTR